jgi:hypothetical protein
MQNPYKILGISRLASNTEITKAFGIAMKQKKYSPDAIAKARKCLMNPEDRIIADYLSPIIPLVKRFRSSDFSNDSQIEYPSQKELAPEQINRLIQIEIEKLDQEDIENESNKELANLIWEE